MGLEWTHLEIVLFAGLTLLGLVAVIALAELRHRRNTTGSG